jgi:hypothetical protein
LIAHAKHTCPQCGNLDGVEIVFIEPVNERADNKDRRRSTEEAIRYDGVEKRQTERRKLEKANDNEEKTPKPNTACLVCDHEWHVS